MDVLSGDSVMNRPIQGEADINLEEKCEEAELVLCQYIDKKKAKESCLKCLRAVGIYEKQWIYASELFDFHNMIERELAGFVGAASAREAIKRGMSLSSKESKEISEVYAEILADLNVTPADLRRTVDFYQEREVLLNSHFTELEEKVRERDTQINERVQVEEALRGSEQFLGSIIDFLPDATYVIDHAGTVISWNRAMETLTGIVAGDMLGKGDYAYSKAFYGTNRPMLIDLVADPIKAYIEGGYEGLGMTPEGLLYEEIHVPNFKGQDAYFMATAARLYDQHGNQAGAIESIRVITERKKAEKALKVAHDSLELTVEERTKALRDAKEHAETANKAKSVFLSHMSHELRTPLNAILGYSRLMQRDNTISPEQREHLGTINRSGEHLLSLINDVLEISRIEAQRIHIETTEFDLGAVISDVYAMFRLKAAAKNLQFILDGMQDLPRYVLTDEGKLRQILINLIGNAIKFTEEGGIAVRASLRGNSTSDKWLLLEVEDTGPGIANEELEKVFQAFEQTASGRQVVGGTGLGMPISRKFARMLGGDITLSSTVGKGSVFRVDLPIMEGTKTDIPGEKTVTQKRVMGLAPGQAVPRILVAEDVMESRALLVKLLQMTGFDVREAVNGLEAVEIASEWHPHFIWMDIRMPVMDGMEAARRIKGSSWGEKIGIAALTASGLLEDRDSIMTAGFDEFVRKPFLEQEIFDIMRKHLGLVYLYDNESEETVSQEANSGFSAQQMRKAMTPELRNELLSAVIALDTNQAIKAVEKIAITDPFVGKVLMQLALDLDYDHLLRLVEEAD